MVENTFAKTESSPFSLVFISSLIDGEKGFVNFSTCLLLSNSLRHLFCPPPWKLYFVHHLGTYILSTSMGLAHIFFSTTKKSNLVGQKDACCGSQDFIWFSGSFCHIFSSSTFTFLCRHTLVGCPASVGCWLYAGRYTYLSVHIFVFLSFLLLLFPHCICISASVCCWLYGGRYT